MRRIFLLFLVFSLLVSTGAVFAQEPPESQEPPTLLKTSPKWVTAIEVKGNKTISTNVIISKMKTRVGAPYQENIISEDLKRIYALGFFSDIKIDTQEYKEGLKVIVTVTESPLIEEISFSGMRRITLKDEKLRELLKSKKGQPLDYPTLDEDVRTLKKLYERKGYSQVQIDYQVDIDQENNRAKVQFKAVEGRKIRIKKIIVEGNDTFSDRRILRLMKTKRAWLLNAGALKEEQLKGDIERLKAFYRREGFTDVVIDYAVKSDTQRPYLLYVTINIQEGKRYLVGNVTIHGNKDISQEDILRKLKVCIPGKVFSQEALQQDISNIQGIYFDRGYIFAVVEETTSLNPYTGRIDIAYKIVENELAYVDKIKIRGNVKTKDIVIRRELRIRPGDRFDGDKLRRSKERLQNLGFFDEVSYDTEDSPVPHKKDLVVEVKETKTGAFSFGGGYSTVDEFVGFVEIEQKNFDWRNFPYFTGDGQNLKLRASIGTLSSGFDLSFTEPWIFDYPVSFGFDAYKRTHEREEDVGYGYDQEILGGDLRLGKEISEYIRGDLMYRIDQIDITDITDTASNDLKKEYGKNTISSTKFGLTYDNRDNVFAPSRGNVLSGSLECAGGPFAGDKDFLKFFGLAAHYLPMFKGSVLEFRGRIGLADSYGDSDDIPIYERFFAGGAYTIRGYEERKVGPIDPNSKDPLGGESMLVGNLEYTYPIFDFVKVAGFYDTGNVWSKMSEFASSGFKSGLGFGLRIKTPIGPLMLDYGIPLDKEPGEDEKKGGRFHFSMSRGF